MKRLNRKANKIFYHGTSYSNAEVILQQQSIKPNNTTNNISNNTQQDNVVFITDSVIDAIGYTGVSNDSNDKNQFGVVFCIDLDMNDLDLLAPGDDVIGDIPARLKVLEELRLIDNANDYSGYEARTIIEKHNQELTQYVKDNYSWQASLDVMSEVAYQGEIPLSKIYSIRVYKDSSNYYETEVVDLESLNELAESLIES